MVIFLPKLQSRIGVEGLKLGNYAGLNMREIADHLFPYLRETPPSYYNRLAHMFVGPLKSEGFGGFV